MTEAILAKSRTRRRGSMQPPTSTPPAPTRSPASDKALLPLGALMLAASVGTLAQTTAPEKSLAPVEVRESADAPEGKDSVRATQTRIGKGTQLLRDVPQSLTVVTERLIDERNLDTVKEALKSTAGITFLAAEGGEEDIRLRGFPLQSTGDMFIDGMRDPAFYDRDTFNLERLELLRGSASMLFGRGSTGGAVNQVSKAPRLIDTHQLDLTLGSHQYRRITGDFNIHTGENAALRLNAMATHADNNGAGSRIRKKGLAGTYAFGIGTRDEFSVNLYYLDNDNGMNYGMPWIRPNASAPASSTTMLPLDPRTYYGAASDYNAGGASLLTLGHTHRFDSDAELKTQLRVGRYERDQHAGAIRFAAANQQPDGQAATLENFGPGTRLMRRTHLKIQDLDTVHLQSDFSRKFQALGLQHELLTGADLAHEKKTVSAARSAAQGGVDLPKPDTTVGRPNDGLGVDETRRVLRTASDFKARAFGLYAQDLVRIAEHWKLLVGLRHDNMDGSYNSFSIPKEAPDPVSTTSYRQKISEWSRRAGLLYQPNALQSYHLSYGTSFNTSGDTYSYSSKTVNTPPEASRNIEVGAKLDSADKRLTTRLAVFHSTKYRERNTDPELKIDLLSGKRHAAGAEIDITGRITPKWEVYGSYMWMPSAKIDVGATGSEGQGTRPSLTPRHSGTVWTTYQISPAWRAGGGLNFRSAQTPNRNPGWSAPGYVTADLMTEYRISERYTVRANLSNLTNKLYVDSIYPGHYIPGAGRMLQIAASMKF
ncbi:TonB-dependent siderophore receptor [Verminephrobacter aporrectodeae subsp. tuberculatae]|uniref:TonB-dependent receptor n=2 Tax=Verminephrobacter aporrectodeae TaxID=1110389 RepID=UPI003908ACCB|nr:TonB-dependent siderophore receptor [Verminephrobacter aporrectodeae subsp. tuberculatae]MCW8170745.1 TonB-dependent siderophore receptor [Verminephrobacter aporrectodeae subsp. tuberculatae]MCW8200312.1 TonB-dependent siderophore receptor [Verminephrobacter aporrectodeae subsp. tuberculatae]